MDQWYYRGKKGAAGPFSRDEIRYLIRTGVVPIDGELRCGVETNWIALKDSDFNSKSMESPNFREQKAVASSTVQVGTIGQTTSITTNTSPPAVSLNTPTAKQPKITNPDHWIAGTIVAALLLLILATMLLWRRTPQQSPGLGDGESSVSITGGHGEGADLSTSDGMDAPDETKGDSQESPSGIVNATKEMGSPPAPASASEVETIVDVAVPFREEMSISAFVVPEGPEEKPTTPAEEAFRIRLPSQDEVVDAAPIDGKIPAHPPKLQSSNLGGRVGEAREAAIRNSGGTAESERAVALALQWLKSIQQPDGSWSFQEVGQDAQEGSLDSPLAATSMAALCFLGAGNTTLSGPEKDVLRRAFDFMSDEIRSKEGRRETMYVHALVMMAFSELAAMEPSEKKAKRNAEDLLLFIEKSQDSRGGGWRYQPHESGDLSVTGWQIMALQSGMTGGLSVADKTITKSHAFLDSVSSNSGAAYSYTPGNSASRCMTAVGLLSRIYLGWPRNTRPLRDGIERLSQSGPDQNDIYFNYYASLAIHHYGGTPWDTWNLRLRPQLVESQVLKGPSAGSWKVTDPHGYAGGQIYQTCLSVLCLEVYYRYLPMFDEGKSRPQD